MKAINVGFNSIYWVKLMESSKDLKILSMAFDDDNQDAMMHSYDALKAILEGDTAVAMSQAMKAISSAQSNQHEDREVECPFCTGAGVLDLEFTSYRRGSYDSKSVTASCSACIGGGSINVSTLFNEYAGDAYPENGIIAILKKDFESAREIAKGFFDTFEQYRSNIEEDSLRHHLLP
jgi:hypothetical protein